MTDFFSTNSFDLAVYACLFVAVVMGFMTGLLRSLATIIGYICGAGIAVAATPKTLSLLANYPKIPTPQTWIVVVAIFICNRRSDQRPAATDRKRNSRSPRHRSGSHCWRSARCGSLRHARDHAGACL